MRGPQCFVWVFSPGIFRVYFFLRFSFVKEKRLLKEIERERENGFLILIIYKFIVSLWF